MGGSSCILVFYAWLRLQLIGERRRALFSLNAKSHFVFEAPPGLKERLHGIWIRFSVCNLWLSGEVLKSICHALQVQRKWRRDTLNVSIQRPQKPLFYYGGCPNLIQRLSRYWKSKSWPKFFEVQHQESNRQCSVCDTRAIPTELKWIHHTVVQIEEKLCI